MMQNEYLTIMCTARAKPILSMDCHSGYFILSIQVLKATCECECEQ